MPIFGVTLIQAAVSKTLRLYYKIFFCLQNISTQKNQPLSITTSQDKRGDHKAPPLFFSFVKYPRPFNVHISTLMCYVNFAYALSCPYFSNFSFYNLSHMLLFMDIDHPC